MTDLGPPITEPERIGRLPRDERGRPIPWFTAVLDGGRTDLRVVDAAKIERAIAESRCWVCGGRFTGPTRAFIVGPLGAISRIAPEPPSHTDCALYSLHVCPFLANPNRDRRTANLPDGLGMPGVVVLDNPGVSLLWVCRRFEVERDPDGRALFRLPRPSRLLAYHGGLPALRTQLAAAVAVAEQQALDGARDDGIPEHRVTAEIARTRDLYRDVLR